MICYLCKDRIGEDEPFYNDYEQYICKPCFAEAPRCWICRFPGKALQPVQELGNECEFCRGNLIDEESDLTPLVEPLRAYLKPFGLKIPTHPTYRFVGWRELRALQTEADLPSPEFIDDYLRHAYPLYWHDGAMHLLRRMTKATFVPYAVVQFAAGDIASAHALPNLGGNSPFHTFARGWAHWLGHQAAQLLGYDLERRQLRKWPELGLMGEFERWERMARLNKPAKMVVYFQAHLKQLAAKHLFEPTEHSKG